MRNENPDGHEATTQIDIKPGSNADAAVLEMLVAFGVKPALESNGRRSYYDVTLPACWSTYRKGRFETAIARAALKPSVDR